MAKELEALKSQRTEDGSRSFTQTSPSLPESAQESVDQPSSHPSIAKVDETGLMQEYFQLDDFVVDRDTVVGIFSVWVIDTNIFMRYSLADFQ
jgi:hypothetical protein